MYGEKANSAPATRRVANRVVNRPASAKAAQPDNTGANRLATLKEATGPHRRVIGLRMAAGANQLVFDMALTPPKRAHMALVRNGLCPCSTAHGNHSNHQTCSTLSPQLQVMAWAGLPPNQTCAQRTSDSARYAPTATACHRKGVGSGASN